MLDRLSQLLRSDRQITINSSGPLLAAAKAAQLNDGPPAQVDDFPTPAACQREQTDRRNRVRIARTPGLKRERVCKFP